MERKECLTLVTKIEEREFRFEIPIGATFSQAYEGCHKCLLEITEMIKKYNEDIARKKESDVERNEENKQD